MLFANLLFDLLDPSGADLPLPLMGLSQLQLIIRACHYHPMFRTGFITNHKSLASFRMTDEQFR